MMMSLKLEPRTRETPGEGVGADRGIAGRGAGREIDGDARGRVAEGDAGIAVAGDGVVAAQALELVEACPRLPALVLDPLKPVAS